MINSEVVKKLSSFRVETFVIPESAKAKVSVCVGGWVWLTRPLQTPKGQEMSLDILVENAGRVNFDPPLETRKGWLQLVDTVTSAVLYSELGVHY